jgi:hypothetical protein
MLHLPQTHNARRCRGNRMFLLHNHLIFRLKTTERIRHIYADALIEVMSIFVKEVDGLLGELVLFLPVTEFFEAIGLGK